MTLRIRALAAVLAALAGVLPWLEANAGRALLPDGPFPVGVSVETVDYQGRAMRIVTWYPALATDGEGCQFPDGLQGTAVLDAAPDRSGAPYPLLLFSHGLGGNAVQSVFYTENLASHGYVVVSGDHDDANTVRESASGKALLRALRKAPFVPADRWGLAMVIELNEARFIKTGFDLSYRPREASFVLDYALARNHTTSDPLREMMDPDRIGATGHSLGGFTTLMIGGVPMHCDQPRNPAGPECNLKEIDALDLEFPCCLDYILKLEPLAFRDQRVKAILPLAPAIFIPHLDQAGQKLEIPLMVITGDAIRLEAPWPAMKTLYDHAPAPKYLIRVKNTDHLTVADATLRYPGLRWLLPGFRSHFQDKAQVYKDYSVAFFNLYVKGDGSGAELLNKSAGPWLELWKEEELAPERAGSGFPNLE